jgi:hypothetical protein
MNYDLNLALAVLERTPEVLGSLLRNLPDQWTMQNEGPDTWSPYDVVGHLIHGERTDWIARLEITLSDSTRKNYTPFDRFAQFEESKGKSMNQLLDEFAVLRSKNVGILRAKNIKENDLAKTAIHPALGTVTLKNLLATWVAHDLDHIFQISRVMASQYKSEVGPWREYLRILK